MVSVDNLKVEFGVTPLFEDVSYVINKRDRIALVGKNGAGKSTMLKILAGLQAPTSGMVSVPKEVSIGYLPQVMILSDKHTVMEEAEMAFEHIFEMQESLEKMNQELADRTDYDSEGYHNLIEKFTHDNERFLMMGGTNYKAEIERTLIGLGFCREDFTRPTSEFSGGWRMRIELAKLLLRRPDVLLLDEPTNHLDIESIQWLENFLKVSAGAVVLVSHDRAFINNVTNRTIEISCGHIYDYKVAYDEFVVLRKERREQQLRAYENQQKQIQDTEDFIERFRYKATKAVQVQSRIKQLEKIVPIEIDDEDNSALRLKFPPAMRSGNYPVICEGVKKAYGNHVVFHDVTLTINRGEKVAFVGKNGEGKSTLVKCIMDEIPYEGKLTIGHNVQIGYFAQNQAQLLELLTTLSQAKAEYDKISDALASVRATGYGIVMPTSEEMTLETPEILKKGNSYGVKLKAGAPSIHMIRVDIDTEISPMVGDEKQSRDLISYLSGEEPEKLWQSNIFGKSVYELIQEGLTTKLVQTPEDVREKFRGSLTRIVNEGAQGLICLIL